MFIINKKIIKVAVHINDENAVKLNEDVEVNMGMYNFKIILILIVVSDWSECKANGENERITVCNCENKILCILFVWVSVWLLPFLSIDLIYHAITVVGKV